ncbi:Gfo/Idh/MocA family protein [Leptospira ilyithenensis]|uniref:Gfo/Idh/MocA family oxidoreductase n=1 Tax=Leptospira ilyithenensis TaxID=2484901 RepID=A0A4R9LLA9_9LEPT|nr:Gfo/Idh/MocA family oxidoreductase [Leptospira ilyithenensis]TGN08342.1 gfo/Idh/MocA family oxidoreductase [Leptospira ilyithenensis]
MSDRKIKVILVGLGRIASKLELDPFRKKPCTHAGVLFSGFGKKNFELELAVETKEERRNDFKDQWGLSSGFPIFENLNQSRMQIEELTGSQSFSHLAIIATPSSSHFHTAKQLLNFGIKNLLIEKPVAVSKKEGVLLRNLMKKKGARIWINHERRYHPQYRFVRDLIEKGKFGKVQSVRANVFTSAKNPGSAFSKSGGGPLLHDGTHAMDLIHWLFGKPNLNYAKLVFPKLGTIEDRATAWFSTKTGIEILLDVSGGRDYFQFEMDILTSSHRLILSNDGFQFWEGKTSRLYKGFQSLSPVQIPKFPDSEKSNAFLGIYQEIVEVIQGKKNRQEGNIEDNIHILDSLESIYNFRKSE